jgi:hypothetical protein
MAVTGEGDTGVRGRVTTVSPLYEPPLEPSEPEGSSPGAREAFRLLAELEAAAPPQILKFNDRAAAAEALAGVLAEGVATQQMLVERLAAMPGDPAFKSRKHPPQLHVWLRDRHFLGYRPAAAQALPLDGPRAEASPHAAPAADQAIWAAAMAEMRVHMAADEFGSYLNPAFLGLAGGELYAVALSAVARDRLRERRSRQLQAAWAKADPAKRPLTLVSKLDFEARVGAAAGGVS